MERNKLDRVLDYQEHLGNIAEEYTLEQIEEALSKAAKEAPDSRLHKELLLLYMTKKFKNWD